MVGARIQGTVRRVYPDNLSIDLGNGLRGKLPRIAFTSSVVVPDPGARFGVGDLIEVVVTKVELTKNERAVIVLRHEGALPESGKVQLLTPGDRLRGTVRKVFPDSVLVELAGGLLGHLRRSRISWFDKKPDPAAFFAPGDPIEVVVREVNRKRDGRAYIELSHRETRQVRPEGLANYFPPGSIQQGNICEFLRFGALVRFNKEFIGFLHNAELSWTETNMTAQARFQMGQSISVMVEGIKDQERRFYVSFRQANECGPNVRCQVGIRTTGVVTRINQYALIVRLTQESFGILRFADMPDEARDLYEVGDRVNVSVKDEQDDYSQMRLTLDIATLGEEWRRLTEQPPPDGTEEAAVRRTFFEGTRRVVTVNYYERNPKARAICLTHYGYTCVVCGFSFSERYGKIGEGFIHVHHTRPLSEAEEAYELDPIRDLRPLCPNCHAIVHRRVPAFTVEEVRSFLKK